MDTLIKILKALCWTATFTVMLSGALRLGPTALRAVRDRPAMFVRTLLVIWIGVPLLTIGVVLAFRVEGLSALVLLLMGFCPGIPLLLSTVRSVHAAVTTAFVALLLTAMTEPLLIPYGVRLISRALPYDLTVRAHHVLAVLGPTVFLPVLLGFSIRRLLPAIAEGLARICDAIFVLGLLGSMAVVGLEALPMLLRVPPRALSAALLITFGDAILGYWAGYPDRSDQKALALATALSNPALAMAIIEESDPGIPAAAVVSTYLVVRGAAILPLEWWMKRLPHPAAHGQEP